MHHYLFTNAESCCNAFTGLSCIKKEPEKSTALMDCPSEFTAAPNSVTRSNISVFHQRHQLCQGKSYQIKTLPRWMFSQPQCTQHQYQSNNLQFLDSIKSAQCSNAPIVPTPTSIKMDSLSNFCNTT